jgi:hypothetical protein
MKIISEYGYANFSSWIAVGFKDMQEAIEYKEYVLSQQGYSPTAVIVEDPEIIVRCSMYNSCD